MCIRTRKKKQTFKSKTKHTVFSKEDGREKIVLLLNTARGRGVVRRQSAWKTRVIRREPTTIERKHKEGKTFRIYK